MKDVPAGTLRRQSGAIQDQALKEPIGITRNGRRRLVPLSAEEYERLKRRDRAVVRPEELDADEIERIAEVEPADKTGVFDAEVDGSASS